MTGQKTRNRLLPPELLTGKIQPQAVELEEAVLGALMLEKKCLNVVLDLGLEMGQFYKDAHQFIFLAILQLESQNDPIDILTVTNQLRSNGKLDLCGGPYYVTQLTNRVASSANIEAHARIIQQKALQRDLIMLSGELQRDGFDETIDPYELLDRIVGKLDKLMDHGSASKDAKHILEIFDEAVEHINTPSPGGLSGTPTPIDYLNKYTGGLQEGNLIIIAARPGMGKTAWMVQQARKAAIYAKLTGKVSVVFSLEMSSRELMNRMIMDDLNLSGPKIQRKDLTHEEKYRFKELREYYKNLPLIIDDTPGLSINSMRSKLKRIVSRFGKIGFIAVDYLQLMKGEGGNREQEISYIARNLKIFAKAYSVPLVALSQLNRSVETRGGEKRPTLSDLRESGAIEQDADMVIFIYRPEYYGYTSDSAGNSNEGVAVLIIAKQRNGGTGDVICKWEAEYMRFYDEGNYGEPPF